MTEDKLLNDTLVCGEALAQYLTDQGETVEFGKASEGKDTLYDMAYLLNPKTTATPTNLKSYYDIVAEILVDYLTKQGISCEYGRHSEGKDSLYDLVQKLLGFLAATFKWDASINATVKTNSSTIVIGSGGGVIDYGDGTTEIVSAGNIGLNHTYDDATKSYNIVISNVKEIGQKAFFKYAYESNSGLISIDLPQTISISDSSFYHCIHLSSISIPQVKSIGGYTFQDCIFSNLDAPLVTSIGTYAFYDVPLTNINCPSLTIISGSFTFCGCTLSEINLPLLSTISGNYTFYKNLSLTNVNLPQLSKGGSSTFKQCTSLKTVFLPKIIEIGTNMFSGCTSLQSVKFALPTPPTISSSNAWDGVPATCKFYVPSGYLEAYQSAQNMPNPEIYTYVEYDP